MNSIFVILNKETNEMLTTPDGKWSWSTKGAAESAYTLHMRSSICGITNNSIPHLLDKGCPYFAREVQLPYDKEPKSKTMAIRKEIRS